MILYVKNQNNFLSVEIFIAYLYKARAIILKMK